MSSIPSSAMPHAGGTTTVRDNDSGSYHSPRSQGRDGDFYGDNSRGGTTLMDRARDNKTGIALAVAVGAIAAAAIPFMLSGRRKSAQYGRDLYVDNGESGWSGGTSASGRSGKRS